MIGEQLFVYVCVVTAGLATTLLFSSKINYIKKRPLHQGAIALIQTIATCIAVGVYIGSMRVIKKVWKLNVIPPTIVTMFALYVSMIIDNAVRIHIGYNNAPSTKTKDTIKDTQVFHNTIKDTQVFDNTIKDTIKDTQVFHNTIKDTQVFDNTIKDTQVFDNTDTQVFDNTIKDTQVFDNTIKDTQVFHNTIKDTQVFHTLSAMTTGLFLFFLMR